jgi:peroxiredoxin (alkyl hydroperoxide reductase subunit C)
MKKVFLVMVLGIFTISQVWSQKASILQIGAEAPSFTAKSTNGKIKFPQDFGSSWKILFAHPKDFTPVCSSEILELAYAQESLKEMGVEVAVMSVDILDQHNSWKAALEELSYKDRNPVKINFPIIDDSDMQVSRQYGMIHDASSAVKNIRGVYIINPDNIISAIYFYPNEVGRNLDELKRTVTALQTTYTYKNVVTPANWNKGDDVIVPVLTQAEKDEMKMPGSKYNEVAWFLVFKEMKF